MVGFTVAIAYGHQLKVEQDHKGKLNTLQGYAAGAYKDPDSAKFRNEVLMNDMLCGDVNAKTGFGYYSGARRFILTAQDLV